MGYGRGQTYQKPAWVDGLTRRQTARETKKETLRVSGGDEGCGEKSNGAAGHGDIAGRAQRGVTGRA